MKLLPVTWRAGSPMAAVGTTFLPLSRNPSDAVQLVLHASQGSKTSKPTRSFLLALWMAPVVVRIVMWCPGKSPSSSMWVDLHT